MSDGLVSYVLAGCAFDAPCETVAKSLAERFGGAIGPAWVKSSTIKDKTVEDKMGFILSVGGIDVLVIYEDFPVPAETFTGAVTYAVLSGSDEVGAKAACRSSRPCDRGGNGKSCGARIQRSSGDVRPACMFRAVGVESVDGGLLERSRKH